MRTCTQTWCGERAPNLGHYGFGASSVTHVDAADRSAELSLMASSGSRPSGQSYDRRATHAGSWYTDDGVELGAQLDRLLEDAAAAPPPTTTTGANGGGDLVRALIAPHAGFSFSGPTAAHAFGHLRRAAAAGGIQRVFVLGPSHHVYLEGCAVSGARLCETPLGSMLVDQQLRQELINTGRFEVLSSSVDEDEHSIEMHLPYPLVIIHSKLGLGDLSVL